MQRSPNWDKKNNKLVPQKNIFTQKDVSVSKTFIYLR